MGKINDISVNSPQVKLASLMQDLQGPMPGDRYGRRVLAFAAGLIGSRERQVGLFTHNAARVYGCLAAHPADDLGKLSIMGQDLMESVERLSQTCVYDGVVVVGGPLMHKPVDDLHKLGIRGEDLLKMHTSVPRQQGHAMMAMYEALGVQPLKRLKELGIEPAKFGRALMTSVHRELRWYQPGKNYFTPRVFVPLSRRTSEELKEMGINSTDAELATEACAAHGDRNAATLWNRHFHELPLSYFLDSCKSTIGKYHDKLLGRLPVDQPGTISQ